MERYSTDRRVNDIIDEVCSIFSMKWSISRYDLFRIGVFQLGEGVRKAALIRGY